ncbi:MAG: DNA primase [Lachnospiraceae bacterium]|nr:DNA primase [Lachnospiraceae bacterium]
MYYPDEIVEDVIRQNNIVDIISPYVQLKKSGANYFGLCPFHNEKSPSFSVSESKQMFYCFGCGEGGNALTFLMKYENASFQEALTRLAERAGITLPAVQYSEDARKTEEIRKRLLAVNKETAVYYYRLLRSEKGSRARAYLKGRQLGPETVKNFGLGFADGASNDLIRHLREAGFEDEEILNAGVAAFDEKRGLHDKFWNRVIFPIQDAAGRVIGFGGRVMGDGKPKYLNSPETPVFDKSRNLYGLQLARRSRKGYLILCEGYMDVISMHQNGFPEAVASLGTSFTEGQAALIRRYAKEVLLAYDSDEAGTKAALRGAAICKKSGLKCRIIRLEPYKDPDEFIKQLGREEFEKRIRDAGDMFLFEISQEQKNYRMDDPASRTEFYRYIARRLCEFTDELEKDNYIKAIAGRYFIKEESLRNLAASYASAGYSGGENEPGTMPKRQDKDRKYTSGQGSERKDRSRLENERLLISMVSDRPALYRNISGYLSPDDFDGGITRITADRVFSLALEAGNEPVLASVIIGMFDTEEEQKEAAWLFQGKWEDYVGDKDPKTAFTELVINVKKSAVEELGLQAENDPSLLFRLIDEKKKLEELQKINL